MDALVSKFSMYDIETLIEAMGDWEMVGNHDFHVLNMIKNAPMPPEDHEAYEVMSQIKEVFRIREKDILASRSLRQEKAIFLKAKLLMVRSKLTSGQLFDMSENAEVSKLPKNTDVANRLEQAEFFIKDLGVWDHFQKFLKESSSKVR